MQLAEAAKEIKKRLPIEQVVRRYVKLSQRGANLFGLCPFHDERNPSFTVRPDLGFFKCFGCGIQGDVFTFIEKHLNMNFLEAAGMLAAEVNVSIQGLQPKTDSVKRAEGMLEAVAGFFRSQLIPTSLAVHYLSEQRKLPADIVKKWGIGFGGTIAGLIDFLKSHGFSSQEAREFGLLNVDGARFFSVFSGRIIFPICDVQDRVVGFSGRVISGSGPKYINSCQSELFDKGSLFYGLRQALDFRAQQLIVVEGFFDVIALHRLGLPAIASCGTSFTEKHAALLKKFTKEVVLCFDSDEAGLKAHDNALKLLLHHELLVKSVHLPTKDADELSARGDCELLFSLFQNPQDALQHKIDVLAKQPNSSVGDRIMATQKLYSIFAAIPGKLTRSQYLAYAARKLSLDEMLLRTEVEATALGKTVSRPDGKISIPACLRLSDEERLIIRVVTAFPDLALKCHDSVFARLQAEVARYLKTIRAGLASPEQNFGSDEGGWLDMSDGLIQHLISAKNEARVLEREAAEAIIEGVNQRFELDQLRKAMLLTRHKLVMAEKEGDLETMAQAASQYTRDVRILGEAISRVKENSGDKTDS